MNDDHQEGVLDGGATLWVGGSGSGTCPSTAHSVVLEEPDPATGTVDRRRRAARGPSRATAGGGGRHRAADVGRGGPPHAVRPAKNRLPEATAAGGDDVTRDEVP